MIRRVHSKEVRAAARRKLQERGVSVKDIAEIVYEMQSPYNENLTMDQCIESVEAVLEKREVQHAVLVGIELDVLAEQQSCPNRCNPSLKAMRACSDATRPWHLDLFSVTAASPSQRSAIWIKTKTELSKSWIRKMEAASTRFLTTWWRILPPPHPAALPTGNGMRRNGWKNSGF